MLVQNKLKEGEIYVLKLVTGDEIIARIKTINEHDVLVQQPLRVAIARNDNGEQAKYLLPWLLLAPESNPAVQKIHILASVEAPKETSDAWTHETSGLVLV